MGLKVLHLIDSGGLYGAEKMLLTLVAEQVKMGLSPMILSAGEMGITEKALEIEAKRLALPLCIWRMKPGLNFKESLKILRWAQTHKFQVLHSHGYKFNILIGFFPKFIRLLPFISTLHGYTSTQKLTKMWVYEFLDKLALLCVDCVVLVRHGMESVLGRRLAKARHLHVIENGIDCRESTLTFEQTDAGIKSFIQRPGPVICAVGRLSPEKGFLVLIRAMSILVKQYSDIKLVLIGEGRQRVELEQLIHDLELDSRVLMPGFVNDPPSVMGACSLLVMPSYTEGLPITLLEALKVCCPIVASAVGGIPKALAEGENGWLVSPGDEVILASKISEVLNSKEAAKKKSENGLAFLLSNYTAERMSKDYYLLYKKVFDI